MRRQEYYTTALSMRCGYGLNHGTKRQKDHQSEKLQNKIYKALLIIGPRLKGYGAITFF